MTKTKFIVNPQAASGACRDLWKKTFKTRLDLFPHHEIAYTTKPKEATELARKAISTGFEKIIAVGGDGTLNEVLNGFFENGKLLSDSVLLGMYPLGTGGDFPRNFSFPQKDEEVLKLLSRGMVQKIDVGKINYEEEGLEKHHYFLNISSFGLSVEVLENMGSTKGFLGKASYLSTSALSFLKSKAQIFHVKKEGEQIEREYLAHNIFVANGMFSGGKMKWAPHAKVDDGFFDVVILEKLPKWKLPFIIPKIYKGTHLKEKEVEVFRSPWLEFQSEKEVFFEADGEIIGKLPATFHILHKCIHFIC
ncbi:MAG: diacylglycerol kinase family lipid kinase [Deltaproteobacteria bacterium]|nr:diacylglycerol kinase family lipid kinase [Deltaproteobacteria bacterium]